MSIKSCIVLFILGLSLYACHGLRPSVFEKNSIKKQKNEKISDLVPMMKKPMLSKEGGFPKEESVKDKINHELKDGKAKVQSAKALTSSSQITESPLGSVSWRVPHDEEHDEQNPGFNMDYSSPKTHPPSHN
ncbi:hypothetical protein SLA2020_473480 [Shorea laevis]